MRKICLFILFVALLISAKAMAGSGNLPGFGFFPNKLDISFEGFTAATYDGDQGGYEAVDAVCAAEYPLSHVCQDMEILWMINQNKALPDIGEGWVNGGPPGYTADANDCKGWSSAALSVYGRYWDFVTDQGWMRGCVNEMKFACCK